MSIYDEAWINFSESTDGIISENRSVILDAASKAKNYIELHTRPVCAISGGSDSDIMIDIILKFDPERKTKFVFFNTGIEMLPTKKHIPYLESKYGIVIEEHRPEMTVPASVHKYGQPFVSKNISEMIQRLQAHNFAWEDGSFEELWEKYPRCKCALKWWCNMHPPMKCGDESKLNINRHKGLKEFLMTYPPQFKISNKCCYYAKKKLGHQYYKDNKSDLNITGVRKAEGGVRADAYTSCFSQSKLGDEYRPLFWFSDKDKKAYKDHFGIEYSECYTTYGLTRTGCAGCPFGRDYEQELEILKTFEPELYKAVTYIFKDSYEYTQLFKEFRKREGFIK